MFKLHFAETQGLTHSTFFEKKLIRHQGGNNYAMYYNFNWKKCNL